MKITHRRKEALDRLSTLLEGVHDYVDVILVEGQRDVESLRALGCTASIETLSHVGVNDFDLAQQISTKYSHVLILTDFDVEGLNLNQRFSSILERQGATVENRLRRRVGRLMAMIGVYAIESLDNVDVELA